MGNILSNWNGTIGLNGNQIDKSFDFSNVSGKLQLVLKPQSARTVVKVEEAQPVSNKITDVSGKYRITVKQYMTKKASPEFDFMKAWNDDCPMPLVTMVGEKIKETKGMVYMKLHGDITERVTERCLCCGKPITNPVSKYFGMGPVCGNHNYVNPFASDEELKNAVAEYRKKLQKIEWTGWIIKSAIVEEEEL